MELKYTWLNDSTLLNYVDGKQSDYNISWCMVDYIYMSYNVAGCHWVLLVIDMVVGQILVWDSLIALTSNVNLSKKLNNMRTILPALLKKVGFLLSKPQLPVTP